MPIIDFILPSIFSQLKNKWYFLLLGQKIIYNRDMLLGERCNRVGALIFEKNVFFLVSFNRKKSFFEHWGLKRRLIRLKSDSPRLFSTQAISLTIISVWELETSQRLWEHDTMSRSRAFYFCQVAYKELKKQIQIAK